MKVPPIQCLIGPDTFQRRWLIEEIRRKLFSGGRTGFNDDTFHARGLPLAEVLDTARTLPMMAVQRLVVFHGLDQLKASDEDLFRAYADKPSPETALVATAEKLDRRTKLFRVLNGAGTIVDLKPPKGAQLAAWLGRILARHGVTMDNSARQALVYAVGADLSRLDLEIERLGLHAHPRTALTEEDVRVLVLKVADDDAFSWTDSVVEGRWVDSVASLDGLLRNGQAVLALCGLLARHFRILLRARAHLDRRGRQSELAAVLGVPPFAVSRYIEQAGKFTPGGLASCLSGLQELDRRLKRTSAPPKLLIEELTRAVSRITNTAV